MTQTEHDDPLLGQTLQGRWHILRILGAGGMGTVYLAEQVSMGGRLVALKVLYPAYSRDRDFVRRFRFEAERAGRVSDPRIVTVYDFGETDDGQLFLVMEYVVGKTLGALIKEGPLPLERAIKFGIQLAEALHTVHSAGLVHRDVKGDNAIVREGREELKLTDFGIAKPTDDEERTWKTGTGVIVGTPRYMAPEQIEHGVVGPRTDIYAWGIVLYEMLTGEAPFSAPTPTSLLLKHLNEAPRPVRERRSEVSAELEHIVLWAIKKKPNDRPQDMAQVLAALERVNLRSASWRGGDPSSVDTVALEDAAPDQYAIRRSLGWVGLAVVAVLLGTVAVRGFRPADKADEPTATEAAELRAEPDPRIVEHLTMAQFFADRGEYGDAVREYESVLALEPGNRAASIGIARTRRAQAVERQVLSR